MYLNLMAMAGNVNKLIKNVKLGACVRASASAGTVCCWVLVKVTAPRLIFLSTTKVKQ